MINFPLNKYIGKYYQSKEDRTEFISVANCNKCWLFVRHIGSAEVSWLEETELEDYEEVQPEKIIPYIFN